MKGTIPKPTEVLKRQGTFRPSRHGDRTPLLIGGRSLPTMPDGFNDEQVEIWDIIIDDMSKSSVLDHADVFAVEAVVIMLSRARQMRRILNEAGSLTVNTRTGAPVARPEFRIELQAWQAARQFMEQLGLTPAARARLHMTNIKGVSALQQLEANIGQSPRAQAAEQKDFIDAEEA